MKGVLLQRFLYSTVSAVSPERWSRTRLPYLFEKVLIQTLNLNLPGNSHADVVLYHKLGQAFAVDKDNALWEVAHVFTCPRAVA